MGFKTVRPDGRRHHAKSLTKRNVIGTADVLVLGTLDEAALQEFALKSGISLDGKKVTIGWWRLSGGHPRKWIVDSDAGEPGAYIAAAA